MVPSTQLYIYQIILNTTETDLKTDRKISTSKGRDRVTLKNVESTEMEFRGETDHRCYGVKGAEVTEKGERERSTWEPTQRTFIQRHWLGK